MKKEMGKAKKRIYTFIFFVITNVRVLKVTLSEILI